MINLMYCDKREVLCWKTWNTTIDLNILTSKAGISQIWKTRDAQINFERVPYFKSYGNIVH